MMKTRPSKILFNYWNEVRGNRVAPRRFEIEPARLAPVLPDAFILERLGDLTIRYRLAGTRIIEQFGAEFRGTSFFDGFSANDQSILEDQLRGMVQQGGGALQEWSCRTASGLTAQVECLILPLVHMADTVDRFVGALSAINPPAWLGDEPLIGRSITACQTVWPDDGKPDVVPFAPPAVFGDHLRAARIVRANQRNFRVYEGGLANGESDDR